MPCRQNKKNIDSLLPNRNYFEHYFWYNFIVNTAAFWYRSTRPNFGRKIPYHFLPQTFFYFIFITRWNTVNKLKNYYVTKLAAR